MGRVWGKLVTEARSEREISGLETGGWESEGTLRVHARLLNRGHKATGRSGAGIRNLEERSANVKRQGTFKTL